MGHLGESSYQHNNGPNKTLSQEERFKQAKQEHEVNLKENKRKKKRAAFCAVSRQINAPNRSLRDRQFIRHKFSVQNPKPRGTFQKQPIKKTNSTRRNKKRKTGSISCCFSPQISQDRNRKKKTQYSFTAPTLLKREQDAKCKGKKKNNAHLRCSDTAANASANSDAPRKFASQFQSSGAGARPCSV